MECSNIGATNETGFTALPGGYRYYNGIFSYLKRAGVWWTSTAFGQNGAFTWGLYEEMLEINHSPNLFYYGFSVRCVKD